MTATPNFASVRGSADVRHMAAAVTSAGPFVLNLCSSTTPMALAQTDLPELKRFTFFVSRRFEEGRERFRLHMGYFATLAEAEEWLSVVREIYPGAWAGEAPGRKLRERATAAPVRTPPAAARSAAPPAARATGRSVRPVFADSNVREVLAALGDASATGETRMMHAPAAPRAMPPESGPLSDTQVLRMLEARLPEGGEPPSAELAHGSIPMLKPDDTGTRRALKEAVVNHAPVSFAGQLQWSVQPAELDKVPSLAIFSAYTLYTVEGSRDGRKWYGLRLEIGRAHV